MFQDFDPRQRLQILRGGKLPHWTQRGATYFVTFRLNDSLPEVRLRAWREERRGWLDAHPPPWTLEVHTEHTVRFEARIQEWLDQGAGSCVLAEAEAAAIVTRTLYFGDGSRYELDEWVVAANHVHALLRAAPGWVLPRILRDWKGYSAHRLGRGPIWQKETYDRIVRDRTELERFREYIRRHREWRRPEAAAER